MRVRLLPVLASGALVSFGLVNPTGAEEIESTCVSCHAEEEDSELSAPVDEWRRSVHAEAEVSCDACHGGDPFEEDEELSKDEDEAGFLGAPGWADVPEFCGVCHEEILNAYSQSVMAGKIAEGEQVAVCTTCHMTEGHAIGHSDPQAILTEERCGECHDPERALFIRYMLSELNGQLERAGTTLAPLRAKIDTSELDGELREIRHRAVIVAHTYDRVRIEDVAASAFGRLAGVETGTRSLAQEAHFRRRLGYGVCGFFFVMLLVVTGWRGELRLGEDR